MEFPGDIFGSGFLIALATALGAGLMRGFAGFGSGMLMAPVFAVLFGPVQTVTVIVLMEIIVTMQLLPGVRREIQWRFVGQMGLAAACFMPLGSWLLVTTDPLIMTRIIAGVVLISAVILWLGWRYNGPKRPLATVLVGALSGTMIAATSVGNPPAMLYMLAGEGSAATARANITGYFAATVTVLIAIMLVSGLVTGAALFTAAALLPVYMAGAWAGSRLFVASSESLYRKVALIFLFAAGILGLLA